MSEPNIERALLARVAGAAAIAALLCGPAGLGIVSASEEYRPAVTDPAGVPPAVWRFATGPVRALPEGSESLLELCAKTDRQVAEFVMKEVMPNIPGPSPSRARCEPVTGWDDRRQQIFLELWQRMKRAYGSDLPLTLGPWMEVLKTVVPTVERRIRKEESRARVTVAGIVAEKNAKAARPASAARLPRAERLRAQVDNPVIFVPPPDPETEPEVFGLSRCPALDETVDKMRRVRLVPALVPDERDLQMVSAFMRGFTLAEIGVRFNMTTTAAGSKMQRIHKAAREALARAADADLTIAVVGAESLAPA